ncbi:hypothetical protein ABH927_001968 [Planotetraspora sp. GP83]
MHGNPCMITAVERGAGFPSGAAAALRSLMDKTHD